MFICLWEQLVNFRNVSEKALEVPNISRGSTLRSLEILGTYRDFLKIIQFIQCRDPNGLEPFKKVGAQSSARILQTYLIILKVPTTLLSSKILLISLKFGYPGIEKLIWGTWFSVLKVARFKNIFYSYNISIHIYMECVRYIESWS